MAQPCSPSIIYFDYHADEERHRRKFAGICRFAKACGWRVATVPPEQSRPASVRGLLVRYNFGGETWQHARPLADLRLEGVRASGLWLPVALNGGSSKDGDMPIDFTMSECSLAFAKPQPEVFSVANVRTMSLADVTVSGVSAPLVRTWDGTPELRLRGVEGAAPVVAKGEGAFECPPL